MCSRTRMCFLTRMCSLTRLCSLTMCSLTRMCSRTAELGAEEEGSGKVWVAYLRPGIRVQGFGFSFRV